MSVTPHVLLRLPRLIKQGIAFFVDLSLAVFAVWLAFYLRIGEWTSLSDSGSPAVLAAVIIAPPIFIAFGLYRAVFRYMGADALISVCRAVAIYGLIYAAIFTAWSVPGVPRTVGIIQPILLLIMIGASRAFGRYWLGTAPRGRKIAAEAKRVLIYGAGRSGQQLALALASDHEYRPVAYVDDAKELQGSLITGLRVWNADSISELAERLSIDEVLLAIPSASRSRRNTILGLIRDAGLSVRTLPRMSDLAAGRLTVSDILPLETEDLLGRDAVPPDERLLKQNITDRCVLVTGAGGSIGSELCRQIIAFRPRTLLLVDMSEYALYAIHDELERHIRSEDDCRTDLVPLLASVCDEERIDRIFALWEPELVLHAAAYKHVPLVEQNIVGGVRNNVIGTLNVANSAIKHRTARFVLVSTDKAVRPTSVMGASKRMAEMILQSRARTQAHTCFTMVRFGNVLGSSGSVVPLFRRQIAAGGPLTVTHRDVTRFFMTIPEAAQLVLQAGAMAKGGEVFVLDMGEPIKIIDLAVRMIELSGLKPKTATDGDGDGDIEIVFTGLRPGEKLYEELLIGNNPTATEHPRIMVANEDCLSAEQLSKKLENLLQAINEQSGSAVQLVLKQVVPEYSVDERIVDLLQTRSRFAVDKRTKRAS